MEKEKRVNKAMEKAKRRASLMEKAKMTEKERRRSSRKTSAIEADRQVAMGSDRPEGWGFDLSPTVGAALNLARGLGLSL